MNEPHGFKEALAVFHDTASTVPAYKDFLKKNKINPKNIKTLNDFHSLPLMDKANYLRFYPYEDLLPHRTIPPIISMSSGSSGQPFYWPRGFEQEEAGGKLHEIIFRDIFNIGTQHTLVIICFSMGTWIAGAFTASSCRYVAQKGYNLTIVTPGIEKEDTLAILRDFAPKFERVILAGYPPFLMDIITEAHNREIKIKRLHINLLLAGENFSEMWRKTIHGLTGIKDSLTGSVSIYGTADADMCGHESPLTIFIRKQADRNHAFAKDFFGDSSYIPTLVHYHPEVKFFEKVDGELLFTAKSGIPLVRYNIKDQGQLYEFSDVQKLLEAHGYGDDVKKQGLDRWKFPMLTLAGRKDVSVTFYALNVYPENIKAGLEDKLVSGFLTGKFIAQTKSLNHEKDQQLIIMAELARDIHPTKGRTKLLKEVIFQHLVKLNSEYRKLHASIGERALPHIELIAFGDPIFQVKKSKHRWIQR